MAASDVILLGNSDFRYLHSLIIGVTLTGGLALLWLALFALHSPVKICGVMGARVADRVLFGGLRIWPGEG